MLLQAIEELGKIFGENQKYERRVAIYINYLLTYFGFVEHAPMVLRNVKVNLKDPDVESIFQYFGPRQEKTDLDILFLNTPTIFGHQAENNYYIEVEMAGRNDISLRRLEEFATSCEDRGTNLFPILITRFVREPWMRGGVQIINFDELHKMAKWALRELSTPKDVPGLAYDQASLCLHILDRLSESTWTMKDNLVKQLEKDKLLRSTIDFHRFRKSVNIRSLQDFVEFEELKTYRRRISDRHSGLIQELIKHDYVESIEGKLSLTFKGSELLLKWQSGDEIA